MLLLLQAVHMALATKTVHAKQDLLHSPIDSHEGSVRRPGLLVQTLYDHGSGMACGMAADSTSFYVRCEKHLQCSVYALTHGMGAWFPLTLVTRLIVQLFTS